MWHSKTTRRQKLLKKLIQCAAPRETFWNFNYFIALISSIFTVFQCEPEKGKWDRPRARKQRRKSEWVEVIYFRVVDYSHSLLWLFGPRNRVVLDCGKLDYTTLSCPINYPPVWGINPSYLPMPSLWNYSPFSDGWRVSNPALENIGEQMKRPPPSPTRSNQKGLFHIQLKLYRINYQAWIHLSYCWKVITQA